MDQTVFLSMKEYPRNTQLFSSSFQSPSLHRQMNLFSDPSSFIIKSLVDNKILLLVFIWKKNIL